jgi:hypothetical protein
VENLNATDGAISALEKGMGASFMQTKSGGKLADIVSMFAEKLDVDEKETMVSFLSQGKDYASQSGQIVGKLEKLWLRRPERTDCGYAKMHFRERLGF